MNEIPMEQYIMDLDGGIYELDKSGKNYNPIEWDETKYPTMEEVQKKYGIDELVREQFDWMILNQHYETGKWCDAGMMIPMLDILDYQLTGIIMEWQRKAQMEMSPEQKANPILFSGIIANQMALAREYIRGEIIFQPIQNILKVPLEKIPHSAQCLSEEQLEQIMEQVN